MAPEPTRDALRVLRILVVDDDQLVRAAMRRSLARIDGAIVRDFSSGRDALDACRGTTFDVGIFDLEMPEMSGIELAHHVRALLPSIRLLFVSSDRTGDLATRARALAVLFPKPWPEDELLRLVRG